MKKFLLEASVQLPEYLDTRGYNYRTLINADNFSEIDGFKFAIENSLKSSIEEAYNIEFTFFDTERLISLITHKNIHAGIPITDIRIGDTDSETWFVTLAINDEKELECLVIYNESLKNNDLMYLYIEIIDATSKYDKFKKLSKEELLKIAVVSSC